jgi:large subunit ribosomal protein L21
MYAIISDRGRQYRVQEGETLRVDRLPLEKGATVTFDQVILVGKDTQVQVGTPHVAGARVTGVLEDDDAKGDKTIAIRRIRTHKHVVRHGHRVKYSVVRIKKIEA